ncbi:conserved hypothetical protein [Anaeromyxobacter sp. K]|uniref:hypothetical protein n=1 Tax=Anaeromyxobacter sp. (strain K) TaxID=447217 RepID=UPI00015F89E9|nr:hypothetical protein [Anaeromyxobacter sp. K]ACG72114.1 conserved hypothetical protein [Anaeromyxobacter sp. K]
MAPALTLAAVLLAAQPAGELRVPDLRPPAPETLPGGVRVLDRGPFGTGELAGSGAGLLLGDAAVIAATYATFKLFTTGTVSASVGNFRRAAFGLAAVTLFVPPLGAVLGGMLGRNGPSAGSAWKAFALSLVGHAAALLVGYLAAPAYWAVLPVQLATMTTGTSVGLHWGPRARTLDARDAPRPGGGDQAAAPAPVAFRGPPVCPDPGA